MTDQDEQPDPKQTHVAQQWKYSSPLITCRFDPAGRFVFSSAQDSTVQRWEFPTGKHVVLEAHDSWVRDIGFLPQVDRLITVGSDDQMILWPLADDHPEPINVVKAHKGWIRTVSASPKGQYIATGGNDNIVRVWDATDLNLVCELTGHQNNVYSTLFHPSGDWLLSGDLDGKVHQWDVPVGKLMRTFEAKDLHTYHKSQRVHYGGVRSMALSGDGKYLACCGLHNATNPLGAINEPLVLLFDWETQKQIRKQVAGGVQGIAWRVIYLPDNRLVVASGGRGGGYLLFWNEGEEKSFHKTKLPDTTRGMDIHPDGMHVATAHYDQHVRISRMAAKSKT